MWSQFMARKKTDILEGKKAGQGGRQFRHFKEKFTNRWA